MKPSPIKRELFRVSPVVAGCTLLVMAGAAYAQQQSPTTLDSVTVTGIRKGIEAAISVKKNSDSIVEAVSAEDIGKLPDNSIAESIARLPGLSAQRVAGRAQVISVRGLSPDFATTLLNGRELVSTGDNRSVEFDVYPSELLAGVTVFKTPDAGLVGQGLSGTLDMKSVRPLSFGSRVTTLGGRLSNNSLGSAANAKASGNRISASYIDQFNDRTVGLAIGFAHLETPVAENQTGTYEPWAQNPRVGIPANTFDTDGIKALRRTGVNKRDGLMATLEVKASKDWTSTVDLFASKSNQTDTANQFESHFYYNGDYPCKPDCVWTKATVNGNQTLTGGVVTNVYPLVRGQYNNRDDKISSIAWNNAFKVADVALNADASYSKANRDETNLEINTQLVPAKQFDTLTLAFPSDGFATMNPTLNYSDASKLFLRNSIYGSGYARIQHVADELGSLKLEAKVPAPAAMNKLFSDFHLGVNYADRKKTKQQPEGNINLNGAEAPIASELQYSPVDLSFAGSNLASIPSFNVPGVVAKYMNYSLAENQYHDKVGNSWEAREKITTAFVKANIDSTWGSIPVRGNVGLQIQSVKQSSDSHYWDSTAPAGSELKPINDGKSMTDVLPALNLAFDLGSDQTLRLAVAKQVARPRLDQLRAGIDFGVDKTSGKPGATGGNPKLDPWRADALDLSYEKYFGTKAYFAAAAFYKKLTSYIYTQSNSYDFSKFVSGYVPPVGAPPTQTMGDFTAPYNGQGGNLSGVELTVSLPFSQFSPSLSGFGITASTSLTNSSIKIKAEPNSQSSVGSADITLPGLSKTVSNLTFYYEKDGFEVRLSQRRRSDFIGEIKNFDASRSLRYVVGENITDAQIGYNFNDGQFKGLGLTLQVNNLSDSAFQTYFGTKDRPAEYIKWGRTVMLGANYKF
ncbi:TonB-dependent receptor [Paucibacter sp. APW11]|uniref:TonB-dependent receptor n=1 Tax=Roseateles aquae TaxID=3077235 RepID=A0ABU3P7U0_9BURK|nr:TonB-dependent receptor [Paucibacter sp. APW11]MDT8998280.1 TonB-dependent receptor [Paucibacter sp. APW11]